MQGRTRLADVAEQAGVSTATVSRVLNGKPEVAGETRKAVLAALDMLGYERPERLRARSAGLIGLIVPELSNPEFPAFAQPIEAALPTMGYTPPLCTQPPGATTEDEYGGMLRDHSVGGIVCVSGVPADAPAFSTDDAGSMELAVRHLASQGHTDIGLAIGPDRFVPAQRKRAGFERAMRTLVPDGAAPVETTLFTFEGGQAAAGNLLDRGCTAAFGGSPLLAPAGVRAAGGRGLEVRRDVSVVGFDASPLMAFTDPPLTTLRQPVDAMSQAAVTSLITEVKGSR